jgi:hypothetical protein
VVVDCAGEECVEDFAVGWVSGADFSRVGAVCVCGVAGGLF